MELQSIYTGFDTLDIAFCGALGELTLQKLERAKAEAIEKETEVLVLVGLGQVEMHVSPSGARNGYAYRCSTGPTGEIWLFKKNTDPENWNIFVTPRAAGLAARGYVGTCGHLANTLKRLGALISTHSINRVDYAMDFIVPPKFELQLDNVVAHSSMTKRPQWGPREDDGDGESPSCVFRGRRLESVTMGKMPGRQIIIYDKALEVARRRKKFWWDIWGINTRQDAKPPKIYRVEVRAGKRELNNRWKIRTLAELEAKIIDLLGSSVEKVRYVEDHQSDTNVTRQTLHPLWQAVQTKISEFEISGTGHIEPDLIVRRERATKEDIYRSHLIGLAIAFGVLRGQGFSEIREELPSLIAKLLADAIEDPGFDLHKKVEAVQARLNFVSVPRN